MGEDRRISFRYWNDKDDGVEVCIEKSVINAPDSEPVNNWGRPIGAPCPPKEDSEESSGDEFRRYEKDIEYRTRRRY